MDAGCQLEITVNQIEAVIILKRKTDLSVVSSLLLPCCVPEQTVLLFLKGYRIHNIDTQVVFHICLRCCTYSLVRVSFC